MPYLTPPSSMRRCQIIPSFTIAFVIIAVFHLCISEEDAVMRKLHSWQRVPHIERALICYFFRDEIAKEEKSTKRMMLSVRGKSQEQIIESYGLPTPRLIQSLPNEKTIWYRFRYTEIFFDFDLKTGKCTYSDAYNFLTNKRLVEFVPVPLLTGD